MNLATVKLYELEYQAVESNASRRFRKCLRPLQILHACAKLHFTAQHEHEASVRDATCTPLVCRCAWTGGTCTSQTRIELLKKGAPFRRRQSGLAVVHLNDADVGRSCEMMDGKQVLGRPMIVRQDRFVEDDINYDPSALAAAKQQAEEEEELG